MTSNLINVTFKSVDSPDEERYGFYDFHTYKGASSFSNMNLILSLTIAGVHAVYCNFNVWTNHSECDETGPNRLALSARGIGMVRLHYRGVCVTSGENDTLGEAGKEADMQVFKAWV